MTARKLFWGSFWILVASALILYATGGWYFSSQLIEQYLEPLPETYLIPGGDFDLEEIQYETPLGEMNALFLPGSGSTWVIHIHGEGRTSAEPSALFAAIQAAGYPQLSISYRNDDMAPADPSGFYQYGASEWEDVSAAVDYAVAHGAERMVLSGFSAGAAHIMSFMLRRSIDAISGILMDSPNIDMSAVIDSAQARRDLPLIPIKVPSSVTAVAKFLSSLRTGVNWKLTDYSSKADLIVKRPVLIHHGVDDDLVPLELSIELAQAKPDLVRLIEVLGAGHGDSFNVDPEKYLSEILSFLSSVR